MSHGSFRVAALDSSLDRSTFKSGVASLDRYFYNQVSQDIKRRVTACFVALAEDLRIAGYYTLSSASILLNELPETLARKLPRYPTVPTVRVGRLAIAQAFKGQGLGAALLADTLVRAERSEIAAYALVVDAKDETAAAFYRHHGFLALPTQPLSLFLPLATVRDLRARRGTSAAGR